MKDNVVKTRDLIFVGPLANLAAGIQILKFALFNVSSVANVNLVSTGTIKELASETVVQYLVLHVDAQTLHALLEHTVSW